MNPLPRLFKEAFPDWAEFDHSCGVFAGIDVDQWDLAEEVEIVDQCGGRSDLVARLRLTHPRGKEHRPEFDVHLWNVLTEAEAFAWTSEYIAAPPSFTDDDGKPDLRAADGTWVEVKSVLESDDERAVVGRHLEAAERGTIIARMTDFVSAAHPGFWRKFDDGVVDALDKVDRQEGGRLVVFFGLAGIDFGTRRDETLRQLGLWASQVSERRGCGVVITWRSDWRNPIACFGI